MKKILFFMVLLVAAVGAASAGAETIYLKSGVTATGKIIEKSDSSVMIDIGGANVTYYKDEIDRIEETPAPAAVAQPVAAEPARMAEAPAAQPAAAVPVSKAKHDLIMQFVDVFGTRASMKANFEQMMSSLAPEEAAKLRTAFNVEDIIEQLVPLYDRFFTEADLQSYVNFYGSADGKKLVATIPQIMRGSVEISARYFEAHMPEEFKKGLAEKAAPAQGTN
ncbi:MAG: DUF2059 domain-containing protein [Candidatus Omnitrophica bacterium]|nr:DUF2059 domain-containing protein [Candidatus Omnitrophota bacterium]